MNFVARFEKIDNVLFWFDTRIYLENYDKNMPGNCIGSIIAKNPGSAKPSELDNLVPLELNGDKMLPYVYNRFMESYKLAGKKAPPHSFIRVWNLFYICDKDLRKAINIAKDFGQSIPFCSTESDSAPITWFGWGGDSVELNAFKERFLKKNNNNPFFYDNKNKCIRRDVPKKTECAKHTQGMLKQPVSEYLETIL